MRKSSVGGRRPSQPFRIDPDDMRASTSRRPPDGRRGSAIPQPGFSNKGRRSSSENRNRMSALPPMKRSKSQVNMNQQTPNVYLTTPMREHNALKFGSAQSDRRLSPFSDGGHSSRKSVFSASAKPNMVVKDTRPLTDKAFQQQEIQKVVGFLAAYTDGQSLAPKGINLRQLTTKLFVDIMNHLLGFFDNNISINMTNYVAEIPLIMRRWGYVGNLNTSWLKTVNTQHAFPHVLGLLSWLVTMASAQMRTDMDVVLQQALQCDDDGIDEAFPYGNAALYMDHLLTQYGLWSKNDGAAEEREEQRFIQDLCNRNGVGEQELREIEEDVRNLDAQLNDPKEQAEMEAAMEEEKKYNACLKDYNLILDYKTRMDEHLNTAETELDETNMRVKTEEEARHLLQNKIIDLRDQVTRQVMSAQERDELLKQCSDITSSIRENEEYISVISNQVYTDDLEMAKKRTNIKKKTQEYNKIVLTESSWLPELEALKDETNILHQGAEDQLAQIEENAYQLLSFIRKKNADLTSQIKQLISDLQEVEMNKNMADHEKQQFEEKVKHLNENINANKARSAEETLEMKREIDSLKLHNETRMNCNTLEEAKAKLQQLIKKRDNGKECIENNKKKALIFFQKSAAITQGVIDSVTKAEDKYLRKKDELIRKTKENLQKFSSELDQLMEE